MYINLSHFLRTLTALFVVWVMCIAWIFLSCSDFCRPVTWVYKKELITQCLSEPKVKYTRFRLMGWRNYVVIRIMWLYNIYIHNVYAPMKNNCRVLVFRITPLLLSVESRLDSKFTGFWPDKLLLLSDLSETKMVLHFPGQSVMHICFFVVKTGVF